MFKKCTYFICMYVYNNISIKQKSCYIVGFTNSLNILFLQKTFHSILQSILLSNLFYINFYNSNKQLIFIIYYHKDFKIENTRKLHKSKDEY